MPEITTRTAPILSAQPVSVYEAVRRLAPEDKLDRAERSGKATPEQRATLAARKVRAVQAAVTLTRIAIDGMQVDELDATALQLVEAWLSIPAGKGQTATREKVAKDCRDYFREEFCAQRVMGSGKVNYMVEGSSSHVRRATIKTLQAVTAPFASAAASYAINCAGSAVNVIAPRFRDQNGESRGAQLYIAGIVQSIR